MPKTTKNAKKSRLKRRFDLTNKKVQFFVVAGIIGILGAGYFTVSSFAASVLIWTPPSLKCSQQPCTSVTDNVGSNDSKNLVTVLDLSGKNGSATSNTSFTLTYNTSYKLCFDAKGSGQIFLSGPNKISFAPPSYTENINITNANAYVKYCAKNYTYQTNSTNGTYAASFVLANIGTTPIRISKVSIENTAPK